jgi:hypothetical protein
MVAAVTSTVLIGGPGSRWRPARVRGGWATILIASPAVSTTPWTIRRERFGRRSGIGPRDRANRRCYASPRSGHPSSQPQPGPGTRLDLPNRFRTSYQRAAGVVSDDLASSEAIVFSPFDMNPFFSTHAYAILLVHRRTLFS